MLTKNFSKEEFVKTSISELQQKNIDESTRFLHYMLQVAIELQKLRDYIGKPVYILSGFRCPELNFRLGGVQTSQHCQAQAADFTVKDYLDFEGLKFIFYWCKNHLNYGELILENPGNKKPWIHFSIPREGLKKQAMFYEKGQYTEV